MKIHSDLQCDSNTPVNPGYVWLQFNPVTGQFGVEAKPDGGVVVNLTFSATGVLRVGNGFQMVSGSGQHIYRPLSVPFGNGSEIISEYTPSSSAARVGLAPRDDSSAEYSYAFIEASGDSSNFLARVTASCANPFAPYFESHLSGGPVEIATPLNTKTVLGQSIFGAGDISGSNTLLNVLLGAGTVLYNNVRTRSADTSVLSSSPTITALSGLISSVHPVTWEVNPSSDACVFAYSGGSTAIFLGASDGVWFPSTTYNVSTGQADHYWRAETECDGIGIAFGVTSWSGSGPRIIIDGVYYSLDGAVNGTGVGAGAGTIYFKVSFAEAKKRRIILEGRYDIKLVSAHTSNNAACTKPADSASAKMVFVGDSNAAMYGYDTKGDSYALVMADCLGIRNTHLTAVSGTGFKAVNGGANYSYVERVADVTGSVGTDIVIAAMSWNDVWYGFTPAEVAAAAVTFLDAVRTAHPAAAIIVHGVITWNVSGGDEALIDAQEAAVAAAISGIGDALIGFIPVRTSAAAPILFGDSTVVGTHANKYVNNGIDHMTPLGNNYVGRWLADRVFEKLAEMLGAEAPAILPPPAPVVASLPSSYTQIDVVKSTPTPPAADTVRIFARSVGGRMMPAAIGPSGLDTVFQPHLGRNAVCWARPVGNSTAMSVMGIAISATGTATAASVTATNRHARMKRLDYLVTPAAATAVAGFRSAAAQFTVGAATAGDGGFHFVCRFGPATGATLATRRGFVGMGPTAAPTDVEPSSITNIVGVGHDAADTNYKIMHRGAGAITKIDTGIPKVCSADRDDVYELALFALPGTTQQVGYEFQRLTTGDRVTGVITTNLPTNTTLLAPRGWTSVGGTSSVIGIAMMGLTIETDY